MSDASIETPHLTRLLDAELAAGENSGVQLSVSGPAGRFDLAVGENGLGGPLTTSSRVTWTCSSKPIGALAFAMAWESGEITPDDPVSRFLPEFEGGGKEAIRMRDLLTHTTGIPDPVMSLDTGDGDIPAWEDAQQLLWMVMCACETVQRPGRAMEYNPISNWFILDRVLTTISGTKPGDSYRSMFGVLGISAALGFDQDTAPELRVEPTASADQTSGLARMNLAAALPLPGTGVWGTMTDLRAVGESLLGARLVKPTTIEAMTSTHWPGTGTTRNVISETDFPYGLGFMTLPTLFGRECSFRTYGHAGGNTSTLLVDPVEEVVIAMYWNKRLNDVDTVTRRLALVKAIYADLQISPEPQP